MNNLKKKILKILKRIWFLNFFRRIFKASTYFNNKYIQILKWGINSNEDTNYTYNLNSDNLTYLIQTISYISNKTFDEIFQYVQEIELNEELKAHIINATKNSEYRHFADLEVRFGRRIGWYAFARAIKPKVIIETGVDKGLGAILLCAALEKNAIDGFRGKYFGTDINPQAGYLLTGKYKEYGEILYGDSIHSLSNFNDSIDLFINDSDHSIDYEYNEYTTIKHLLSSCSLILGDNSHFSNSLSKFSIENNRNFIYFQEKPENHWYPGGGIGISFTNSL